MILVYVIGEMLFNDGNGNNVYDLGEDYQDFGDFYFDLKFCGYFDSSLQIFLFGGMLVCVKLVFNSYYFYDEMLGVGVFLNLDGFLYIW